ncbi:MAG: 2,4'-dihydroxyacetophenone dioxygenase family protein [Alphaproteobacteria bacterium]|tara:strand:- start:1414 stop:1926 length:513 start_codon:yes stop_codon:yes gene_type:complete
MPDNIERIYSSLVPEDMKDELYWKDGLNPEDDRLWVPIGPGRWSRPLCLNVSQGYWVHFIKVTEPGIISRHRHPAPVHGFVVEGKWRYLERNWEATAGSYLYEPPGDVHTLVVDEGDSMITLFHNTGALLYCDEDGEITGTSDVFDRVKTARNHFEEVGLGADFVKNFIR